MNIIKSHVYRKFGCTVVNKDFEKMTPGLREEFALCAYSLAGRTCEKHIREYVKREYTRETRFAVVFEAGDKGKGKLQKRLAEDSGLLVTFRPKKTIVLEDEIVQHGFVPLQAADWLAHELNLASQKIINTQVESESELRWPMQRFLEGPFGHLGIYTLEELQEMEKGLELHKEIVDWETRAGLNRKRGTLSADANAKGKTA